MITTLRLARLVRLLAALAAVLLLGGLLTTTLDPTPVAAQSDDDDDDDDDGLGDDDDGVADNDDDDGLGDDDDDGLGDDDDGVADNDDDDGVGDDDDDDGLGDDDDGVADNDDDDDDDDGSSGGPAIRNGLRLAGANRILTSIAISQSQFTTATSVYLANADGFADALSGGVLTDGPILLVPADGDLPAEVCSEITRLGPTDVVALGGELSVSASILDQAIAC